jgi:beta-mannosidase
MKQASLDHADWTVRAVGDLSAVPSSLRGREVPARVPGCVHTDLIRAGLIADPLVAMNEREVQWIGETDWEYRCRFEPDADLLAHERVDLACGGLDTIAEVRLNAADVGRAANMFHPHRFDVRAIIRAGENVLSITFRSPLKHIRAEELRLGKRPVNGDWDPYIYIRKAACNFGWDFAPKVATCGVWKSVRLDGWDRTRIRGVRPGTQREMDGSWTLDVDIDLEWSGRPPRGTILLGAEVDAEDEPDGILDSDHGAVQPGTPTVRRRLRFPHAREWAPRGHGHPKLYPLTVWLTDNCEGGDWVVEELDQQRSRFGFRVVKLRTPGDDHGAAFVFEVNGREVFCKGANWVPGGPWSGQVSSDTYRDRLQQAASANMNMLRVWGGGYYEDDAFYEICDELGIMVWQDFMFACAMYPEEEPYPTLVEAEARHQVARLASHPSVVLWCGGNECTWAHDAWGNAPGERPWKERLGDKSWGAHYYHDLLPRIVGELSPGTPYWPNSPYPGEPSPPPNSADRGDRHTWDLRGEAYRNLVPRFCSEFGQQSPSNYATLARVLAPADLEVASPALEHRQRATGGTKRHIDEVIAGLFRAPRGFDEWHYLAQLAQARAVKTGIEWLRVNRPRCMGALVWQLNDCWPGMSWSLIGSDGSPKLAAWAAKEAFEPRRLTLQPVDGRLMLFAINDSDSEWNAACALGRYAFSGERLAASKPRVHAPARSVAPVADVEAVVGAPGDPTRELIVADAMLKRAAWFYRPDMELSYPQPRLRTQMLGQPGEFRSVRVEAETLLRDLCLFSDRMSPDWETFDGHPITLLPGESVELRWGLQTFQQRGEPGDQWRAAIGSPPVLCCANRFGAAT